MYKRQTLSKRSDSFNKGGDAFGKGDSFSREGDALGNDGDSYSNGGDALGKGGNPYSKGNDAWRKGGVAYGKSSDDGKLKGSPFSHGSAPTSIRVNCILPGNFGTPMTAPMKKYEPEVDANLSKGNVFPNPGLGQPLEFATFAVMMLE